MNDAIPLGRVDGILVRLHSTWFLVAGLVVWSLADSYFPRSAKGYEAGAYWGAAVVVALLFFASLLAHELAHATMARRRGLEVVDVTLYLFGGVAAIKTDVERPDDEFWITVVGPLTSLSLAGLFGLLWLPLEGTSELLGAMLAYLATINFFLAIFNLLPGFPLDGGRLLRAFLWWRGGDADRATRSAATAGVILGYGLIGLGIVFAFRGFWVNGLWLVFVGWYLQSTAETYRRQTETRALFAGLRVADLTNPHPIVVSPEIPLDRVVHDLVLGHNIRAIPVLDGDRLLGLVTLSGLSAVPSEQWSSTTAGEIMIPADRLHTVSPDETVEAAVALLIEHDVNQLPVLRDGHFVGLLSRSTIMRHLEIRSSLPREAVAQE